MFLSIVKRGQESFHAAAVDYFIWQRNELADLDSRINMFTPRDVRARLEEERESLSKQRYNPSGKILKLFMGREFHDCLTYSEEENKVTLRSVYSTEWAYESYTIFEGSVETLFSWPPYNPDSTDDMNAFVSDMYGQAFLQVFREWVCLGKPLWDSLVIDSEDVARLVATFADERTRTTERCRAIQDELLMASK